MQNKENLETLKQDYQNHLKEYKAIERQDGSNHAWFVKGKILRKLFDKIKKLTS